MSAKEAGKVTGRAAGGYARAEALSPKQRQEIARKAAEARWSDETKRAEWGGVLEIAGAEIPCYVLETEDEAIRVLSTRGIMAALGRTWRGRKYTGTELPVFLEAASLKPFIPDDLGPVLSPINFRTNRGAKAEGFRAEVLPLVCDIYMRARAEEGALTLPQQVIADRCELLVRGLSIVGVIAMVDEATGYQEIRDRLALQDILEKFLRTEFAAWAKRFPDEFYKQIFRLRKWEWRGMSINRPQVVAYYTKDIVYERLAPHILKELEKLNPIENGRRKARHHQWLTEDIGHVALAQHLHALIVLMRACKDWDQFMMLLDTTLPKRGQNLFLFTDYSDSTEPQPPSLPPPTAVSS